MSVQQKPSAIPEKLDGFRVEIDPENKRGDIVLDRPPMNVISMEQRDQLRRAFEALDVDDRIRVIVLRAQGDNFSSGGYINGFLEATPEHVSHLADNIAAPWRVSKPVIAAVAGPAVAGGMELAIWADIRVMEETAFMGVYCRRWGVPLIDGGTVRLPRLVGEGRAIDLILTGRRVDAHEALEIGLCEYVVPEGEARAKAEEVARGIARFPQSCLRADRRSARAQHGLSLRDALRQEWWNSKPEVRRGIEGAARFAQGKGRGGDFDDV